MRGQYLDILEMDRDPAELARVAEGNKIADVYSGNHLVWVKNITFDLYIKNVFRKVIEKKIGVLYQSAPTREITDCGLDAAFKNGVERGLTSMMKKIMLNIELYGKVFVDWQNQEMFPPMRVFEKDGRQMVLRSSAAAKKKFQWVYDNTKVYEFIDKKLTGTKIASSLNMYTKEDGDHGRTIEMAGMQLELTKLGTFLKTATILQAVDQLFTDDDELRSINMSPEVVNFKSRDSTVELLHFKADLREIRETWIRMEEGLYEISGVPRVAIIGDVSSASAKELMAKWFPLVETYRGLGQEYSWIEACVVADIMRDVHGLKMEPEAYTVTYDRDFLPTQKRDRDDAAFDLENNVITLKTLLKEENPVLTDSEIEILQKANIEENKKYKPEFKKKEEPGGSKGSSGEG